MNCPLCTDQMLRPHHRGGVEIDICPNCHGMWLDRGELEKLIGTTDGSGYARSLSGAARWPGERTPETGVYLPPPLRELRREERMRRRRTKAVAERLTEVLDDVVD